MLEKLTAASLSEQLNTKFRLHLPSSEIVELELTDVEDFGSSGRQERFSILFKGPLDPAVWQGMYRLDHDHFGTLDLFIVAIGKEEDGMRYEAVFNRLNKPQPKTV
ncbi:MAG TPA: hypothetical protein VLM38_10225 [Blastocatellia bacterium]|nr:hypothetical protein [Blastocatellia bacterium]